jgi:hypothetical protein
MWDFDNSGPKPNLRRQRFIAAANRFCFFGSPPHPAIAPTTVAL